MGWMARSKANTNKKAARSVSGFFYEWGDCLVYCAGSGDIHAAINVCDFTGDTGSEITA